MKRRIHFFLFCFLISGFCFQPPAFAACTSPVGNTADMIYNADAHIPEYCNGVSWVAMAPTINLPTTNGLVGWWKLDDGSGTSATDSSGNGNTGTLNNGPVWTTGGYYNGAAAFASANSQAIDIGMMSSVQVSAMTLSAWVNPTMVTVSQGIFGGSGAADNYPEFRISASAKLELLGQGVVGIATSTGTISANTWTHVGVTYDSGGNYVFYINGVASGSGTNLHTFTNGTDHWMIGKGYSNPEYFDGEIDDARVYNRALSAAEILTLYSYHISPPSSGLSGWWKLNESGGTTAADSSGNGNNGTLVNGPTWTTSGKINGAAVLVSASHQDIDIGIGSSLQIPAMTFSAWVNPTMVTVNQGIVGGSGAADNYPEFRISTSATLELLGQGVVALAASTGTISANTWTHVAVTYDSRGHYVFYINSVASGSGSSLYTFTYGTDHLTIGKGWSNTEYFDGTIDDVRVYNRALSADEIYGIYRTGSPVCSNPSSYEGDVMYNGGSNHVVQFCDNASWRLLGPVPGAGGSGCTNPVHPEGDMIYSDSGAGSGVMQYCDGAKWIQIGGPNLPSSGLVGYWKFDEGSGMTAADSSGNGYTGTLTNGPVWTTSGKDAGALSFNSATTNYVDLGNAAGLQLTTGTISAWINTSNAGSGDRGIVAKQYAYGIFLNGNVLNIYDWGSGAERSTGINLADNTWHHVVVTFQSNVANGTIIYIDGISKLTTYMLVSNQGTGAVIGAGSDPGTLENFGGLIDEVRIYNRALTPQEIWQLYNGT